MGGRPTHFYDYDMPTHSFVLATESFVCPYLCGALSVHIIAPHGIVVDATNGGHCNVYSYDEFRVHDSYFVSMYNDIARLVCAMTPDELQSAKKRLYMTDKMYLEALERLRKFVVAGLSLEYEDSNEIGDKYTCCTWGLCSELERMWPEPSMHLWPDQFIAYGRIAPLYCEHHHLCPCDTREEGNCNERECPLPRETRKLYQFHTHYGAKSVTNLKDVK